MMSNQYCHFSCQPTPSKLTTMNCGGFWPGLSLVGTNPSASAPDGAFVGATVDSPGTGLVVGFAVLVEDGLPFVVGPFVVGSDDVGSDDEPGVGVTKTLLVMVMAV